MRILVLTFLILLPLAAAAQDPYITQSRANQAANQVHIDQMYARRALVIPQAQPAQRYYGQPFRTNPAPAVAVPAVPGASSMTYGNATHIMVPGEPIVTCITSGNLVYCN